MNLLVTGHDLGKSYSGRPLFAGLRLEIHDGDRIGLIGQNGSGKSTLLAVLNKNEPADSGEVVVSKGCRLVHLPQEDRLDANLTLMETVLEPLRAHDLEEVEREVRTQQALSRVGLGDPAQAVGTLSGGDRKRLALARAIAQAPDLMLLDEPTNHLDLDGILWLQTLLAQAPFAYVLVTHDRCFLEQSTNAIIELSRRYPDGLLRVAGTYSRFLQRREERLAEQAQQETALSSRVKREVEWLQRGPKARTTKAQARIEQAGQLQEELHQARQRVAQDRKVRIDFDATGRKTKRLLQATGIGHGFGERQLFSDVDVLLRPGVRLGLVGSNGAGKSTLLKILAEQQAPQQGTVTLASGIKLLTFEQDRSTLDPEQSLRRALAPQGDSLIFRGEAVHVAGWAARFLFRPEQLEMQVGRLSGGEQARILLARLMLRPADILLLDEPTNDLDIDSLEVLESSLLGFPGALVLVSHDRFLLDRVCTAVLGIDGEGNADHCADLSQWLALRARRSTADRASKKKPRRETVKVRKLTYKEKLELDGLEKKIAATEAHLEALQEDVQTPEVTSAPLRLRELVTAMEQAEQTLQQQYARWEELETIKERWRTPGPQ